MNNRLLEKAKNYLASSKVEKKLKDRQLRLSDYPNCYIDGSISFENKVSIDVADENILIILDGTRLIGTKVLVRGKGNLIVIGEKCRIRGVHLRAVNSSEGIISIGSNTTWESGACFVTTNNSVNIGKDCMFSNDVMIRSTDHHGIFDLSTKKLINSDQSVSIEDHVWIGNGARVLKGAYISQGSILGQKSILSGSTKANSIYAGVPARMIKSNITWSRTYSFDDIPIEYLDSHCNEEMAELEVCSNSD